MHSCLGDHHGGCAAGMSSKLSLVSPIEPLHRLLTCAIIQSNCAAVLQNGNTARAVRELEQRDCCTLIDLRRYWRVAT